MIYYYYYLCENQMDFRQSNDRINAGIVISAFISLKVANNYFIYL